MLVNSYDTVLLGDNFNWVTDMFDANNQIYEHQYSCKPAKAQIFMFQQEDRFRIFRDTFIAVVPHSRLLK